MEELEERGIVGPKGSGPREVMVDPTRCSEHLKRAD